MESDKTFVDLINPLDCSACKHEIKDPIRLTCQHCFCRTCIVSHDESTCPVCEVAFCPSKISTDRVLNYVIESSKESTEACANCDQIYQPMNFCETCCQPLCEECVQITHSAKLFKAHQITPLKEQGRLRGQLICSEHNGSFVLYCQEARKLMCIECFNSSSLERRNHFVNIETAHKICREKLDKSVIRLRCFQNELKEHTDARTRLLAETESKFMLAEEQVIDKFNQIIDVLTKKKDEIIEEINENKEKQTHQIQRQINTLSSLEGPIKLNLLSASIFCSYASNLDLLHCYSDLNKNINAVMSHKLEKISFNDNTPKNYVESLMSTLRELDLKSADSNKENLDKNTANGFPFVSLDLWKRMDQNLKQESTHHSDASRSLSPLSFQYVSKNGGIHISNSLFLLDSTLSSFDEQFQKIDTPLKQFSEETNSISKELLDLQRDITLRRCLLDKQSVNGLVDRCENLSNRLNSHANLIQQIKESMTDIWNEHLEVLYKQQSLVQIRLNDLTKLQCFTQQALEIGQKLRPLANFLSQVIGAVDTRRSGPTTIPPMEQICMEILNILPDSKQRCEAIEKVDEERRLTQENKKLEAACEVKALKKNLKETKKSRQRPISTIIVEQNRDRDDMISPSHSQQRLQKRTKRPSQSDETSSVCSISPRTLSSTVSLDVQTLELPISPNTLSPLIASKRSESESAVDIPPAPPSPLPSPTITNDNVTKPTKLPIPLPSAPSAETMVARELLMQSIKEKVKRID